MELNIRTGLMAPVKFIDDVFNIDKCVYPPGLSGTKENLCERYNRCPDSFILIYNKDTLVGYLNLFPISQKLYDEMNDKNNYEMRDDDIKAHEIAEWQKTESNELFILSVAIIPEYQKSKAIILLSNELLAFLRQKVAEGYKIGSISGSAVSQEGANFLKRFRADFVKELEGGYKFYKADRESVEKLLNNGLLLKSKQVL